MFKKLQERKQQQYEEYVRICKNEKCRKRTIVFATGKRIDGGNSFGNKRFE